MNETHKANESIPVSRMDTMPDWKCSFCASINASNAISCSSCHKTREESDNNFFELHAHHELQTLHPAHQENTKFSQLRKKVTEQALIQKFRNWTSKAPKWKLWTGGVAVASAFLATSIFAISGIFSLSSAHSTATTAPYKVIDVHWERSIAIERFGLKNKKNIASKSYGFFRNVRSEGKDNNPKWPALDLGKSADGKPDKEGRHMELYLVRLEKVQNASTEKTPKTITINASENDFRKIFAFGKVLYIEKDGQGNIKPLSKDSIIIKTQK